MTFVGEKGINLGGDKKIEAMAVSSDHFCLVTCRGGESYQVYLYHKESYSDEALIKTCNSFHISLYIFREIIKKETQECSCT